MTRKTNNPDGRPPVENVTINLLLAPGQWKLFHVVKLRNMSKTRMKRIQLVLSDVVNTTEGKQDE